MLRNYFTTFALILSLAFAQIAAIGHQAQHLSDFSRDTQTLNAERQNNQDQNQDTHSNAPLCDKCVHFSGLAHGLTSHAHVFTPPQLAHVLQGFSAYYSVLTPHFSYTARAPPSLV